MESCLFFKKISLRTKNVKMNPRTILNGFRWSIQEEYLALVPSLVCFADIA